MNPLTVRSIKGRVELELMGKQVDVVPPEFVMNTTASKIRINGTKLSQIPDMSAFTMLEELNIANNQFTEIPKGVTDLPHLKRLVLSNNKITVLPDQLFKQPTLEEVVITENNLISLYPFDPAKIRGTIRRENLPKEIHAIVIQCNLGLKQSCDDLKKFYDKPLGKIVLDVLENKPIKYKDHIRLCHELTHRKEYRDIIKQYADRLQDNAKKDIFGCLKIKGE